MRKLILVLTASLCTQALQAQHWTDIPAGSRNLESIKEQQEQMLKTQSGKKGEDEKEHEQGKVRKEGKNYHFSRWLYYWQQHTDAQGNMVSPVKTLTEWNKYRKNQSAKNRLAKTTNQSQWTFTGPTTSNSGYNGIGRINVVTFHPTDTNTFIIGSAGGGAWRTTDGGLNWTSLYDNLSVLGVSDIDYNPLNPNTIYLCTGDRDASDTYSVGLLKSTDGGLTWNPTGLQFDVTDFRLTNELLINPLDTNSLTVAASTGVLKSYDGGASWTNTITNHFKDIAYHPTDTSIMYAATYNANSNILRSLNGGASWTQITNFTNTRRIALAVTAADPNIVKAVVANDNHALNGIYHSADTGATFTKIFGDENDCTTNILSGSLELTSNSCSGQGWYDLCITINPADANKVLVGGVNTYQSLDGGFSFDMVTEWYSSSPVIKTVHADKHFLIFHPLNPSLLYECNDGGLYRTADPSSLLWNDLTNGMGITQFYRNAIADVADFVVGGSQDNGTKSISFTGVFDELTGGDGMDCQINYTDPTNFYTSTQYGSLRRTNDGGANFDNISDNIPGDPEGEWITPMTLHPTDPNTVLAGYDHLYISFDQGDNWTDISPGFSMSGTQRLRRIAVTDDDAQMIAVIAGGNILKYTHDLGNAWTTASAGFSGTRISDVTIDPWNKNYIWTTYSGYGNPKVARYEVGVGWTQYNDSLPDVPVHCIVIDSSNGTKYIGTDVAVFYRDTSMTSWALYNDGLPTIEVTDLAINYTTHEIWGSTYGRGMWKSPRHITQPPISGIGILPLALDVITVSPNPNKGEFVINTTNESLFSQAVEINIVNFSGTAVVKTKGQFSNTGKCNVSGTNLARGTYIVEVNKNGLLFARTKMVIM